MTDCAAGTQEMQEVGAGTECGRMLLMRDDSGVDAWNDAHCSLVSEKQKDKKHEYLLIL